MSEDARAKVAELIESKYRKLIEYIAESILNDKDLAEDAYQEVAFKFVSMHDEKFDMPPKEMRNYLCAAAKNTALTMLKRNGLISDSENDKIYMRTFQMDVIEAEAFHDKYGFGPEMQELLSKLDSKDKDIICLKYGCGYSNREIGLIIDMNEEAVKKRLYRAKVKMQSILISRGGENDGRI